MYRVQRFLYMVKKALLPFILLLALQESRAQVGVMKMVGKNSRDYSLGFGAYVQVGLPISEADAVTAEIGVNFFFLHDGGSGDGTAMCPLKLGYRYSLNRTGYGFYLEPQAGYNLYGVTSKPDENGNVVNLKYHGVVLAAGLGYMFDIWQVPFDVRMRYETVIAHGGSNNMVSLGFTRSIGFRKKDN
jgi:hypothetical protein